MASELLKLKTMYNNYISPDDIFNAILSRIKSSDIPKDPGKIHKAVFTIKQRDKFSNFLEKFDFDNSGITPFSELLDQILFRLESSGILKTLNPAYERYNITHEAKILNESFNKFPEGTKTIIEELSVEFEKYID